MAIIEPFNKGEDLSTGLISRMIGLVVDEFILQSAKEALCHRIVIAVALPTHARCHAQHGELPLVGGTAILYA